MNTEEKFDWMQGEPIPELSKNDYFKMQGATMAFIEALYYSNDEKLIHHLWEWLLNQYYIHKIDDDHLFTFFKMAQQDGCNIERILSRLFSILFNNRTDIEDDTPERIACALGSSYFTDENSKPNKV
ncbi:MAG: hypothetical protein KF763_13150 [Cyclobacteriaceae bacterium]|nr:hypothetical protein [Cyclobacteriaceae bacterium]